MSMTRSGLLVSILAVLATGTAACPQTIPDVFNVQPTIIPLERVQLLGIENLRLVRLVTRTSALAHGDSSLSESYQPAARLGIGRYNPLYFELETSPGRVGFIVHKSHAGMLAAHPGAPGVLGPVDPDPDVLRQTQTIVYDHRGDPQYYVLKSGGKVFVKKANYDEKGTRIGRVKRKDRARYAESAGYRIVDGEVWHLETVFVSWGNLMSVHPSEDGNTLRFHRGIRPEEGNLMATVRRTGTIANWVDHLEHRYFRDTEIRREAYLGNGVSLTDGEVTWHRPPEDEMLLDRTLAPESFILFSVIMLGDLGIERPDEDGGLLSEGRQAFYTQPFVFTLGEFEVRINPD